MYENDQSYHSLSATLKKVQQFLDERQEELKYGLDSDNLYGRSTDDEEDENTKKNKFSASDYFSNVERISGLVAPNNDEENATKEHTIDDVSQVLDKYAAFALDRLYYSDKKIAVEYYDEWLRFLYRHGTSQHNLVVTIKNKGGDLIERALNTLDYETAHGLYRASINTLDDSIEGSDNPSDKRALAIQDFFLDYGVDAISKYATTCLPNGLIRFQVNKKDYEKEKRYAFPSCVVIAVESYAKTTDILSTLYGDNRKAARFIDRTYESLAPHVETAEYCVFSFNKDDEYEEEQVRHNIENNYKFTVATIDVCFFSYSEQGFVNELNNFVPTKMQEFMPYEYGKYAADLYKNVSTILEKRPATQSEFIQIYGARFTHEMIGKNFLTSAGEVLQKIREDCKVEEEKALIFCKNGTPVAMVFNLPSVKTEKNKYHESALVVFNGNNDVLIKNKEETSATFKLIPCDGSDKRITNYKVQNAINIRERALSMKQNFETQDIGTDLYKLSYAGIILHYE